MTERQRNGSVNLAAYTRGNFLPSEQSEIKFDSLLVPDKFKTEEKQGSEMANKMEEFMVVLSRCTETQQRPTITNAIIPSHLHW